MNVLDILNSGWAIMPENYQQICGIYGNYLNGEKLSASELSAKLGRDVDNEHKPYDVVDGVAVISVNGVMARRANLFSAISGGASTELLQRDLQMALDDAGVHSILTIFNTPGGTVEGLPEFANAIFNARDQKPIVSLAEGLMASAGVWAGTAASEVYMSGVAGEGTAAESTTMVGSIGVVSSHVDVSNLEKNRGVKTTEIYAGKYKRIDTQYEPLTEEGRASIQERVDYLYGMFVDAVAKHRGVSRDVVLTDMADAKMFVGQQAVDAGLVDGIKTRDEIISMLNERHSQSSNSKQAGNRRLFHSGAEATMQDPNNEKPKADGPVAGGNGPEITAEYISANYPGVADALRKEGADAETKRVNDVFAESHPGHGALIKDMALDGKTTGPEAAQAVLRAEREKLSGAGADMDADAPDAIDVDASASEYTEEEKPAKTPKQIAAAAQELVAKAEANGQKLSYSAAVKQVTSEA